MPKRILFIGANPNDTAQLRLQDEINLVQDQIQMNHGEEYELTVRNAATKSDLIRFLNQTRPNILHISGHGNDDQTLVLEDEEGNSAPISIPQLGDLLGDNYGDDLDCVIMAACYSLNEIESFSPQIGHTIGMSRQVLNTDAMEFTQTFYNTLFSGRTINESYQIAVDGINLGLVEDSDVFRIISNADVIQASGAIGEEKSSFNWKIVLLMISAIAILLVVILKIM